ncbi:hypothetical protein PG993_015217 [Apiospora rasikravindrae]|uniref:Heterokaryon incompatibility domain-containing protein n=1 Tax=Apiospora rasikravindrae TaxID=990691 RepID=A0ABR1RS33_9PEZI
MPKSKRKHRRQGKRQRRHQRRRQKVLKYTYEPITADYTTRMLTIHNGAYRDQLTGDLEMAKLDDCLPWKALSYAWGTTTTYSRIKIGKRFIKISNNLDGALRRLRCKNDEGPSGPGFRLWVDQICINQENLEERSQQVQLMYNIYEKAEKVLVWLGPDPDKIAEKATFALRQVASLDDTQISRILREGLGSFEPTIELEHLKTLLDRPWFRRLWVAQEVGTDTPAEFYWGQECMSFDILYKACNALYNKLLVEIDAANLRCATPILLYKSFVEKAETTEPQHADFTYQLYQFNKASRKKCLDPKDRVFALLGHYSARIGPDKHLIMQADYSSTETAVYRELAIRALTDAKSTFILNAVEHKGKQHPHPPHI